MALGIALDGMISLGEMTALARQAETSGAASLWMAEHMGYRDAVSSSAVFLASTRAITVVPAAISVYVRHPMITAMTAATLEELAPGRSFLTLASGNPRALGEMGLSVERPVTTTREYVRVLRELWRGEPVTFAGERFRLRDARVHVGRGRGMPIYIAAMGPRMLALAGEISDGVVLSAGLSPAYIRHSLALVEGGARGAAREAKSVARAGFVLAAVADDGAVARREAKKMLAYLFRNRFIAENLAMIGARVDREGAAEAAARGDWETAVRRVPDEVVRECAIAGTLAESREQLGRFREAGLEHLVLLAVGDRRARELAVALAGRA
jgi:5,10-methylenetetrahydromethanopterin reductase